MALRFEDPMSKHRVTYRCVVSANRHYGHEDTNLWLRAGILEAFFHFLQYRTLANIVRLQKLSGEGVQECAAMCVAVLLTVCVVM